MNKNRVLTVIVVALVLGAGAALAVTYPAWRGWFAAPEPPKKDDHHAEHPERVKLSQQARKNLRLKVEPVQPTTYWRRIPIPGAVVDRPGRSDRAVTAPIAGVVTEVFAVPGKTVRPGDDLFSLRLNSESFQTSQMELYKAILELEIAQRELDRLEKLSQMGGIAQARILELQYQKERFTNLAQAHRQDLKARRLADEQITSIEKGKFVTHVSIKVPEPPSAGTPKAKRSAAASEKELPDSPSLAAAEPEYEIQELKANLGDFVQAGQALILLADHRLLYLEGRGLKQEASLLAQAAREGWAVEPEFTEEIETLWPEVKKTRLRIEFLAATTDPTGLTIPFYVPFVNPVREYAKDGKTYRSWLFRPGQRVLLKVAVEKYERVLVLPREAVVREGPEFYVFRQNGDLFERKPVHVVFEDTDHIILANDGSVIPGNYIAQNGAAALNRVLKAKASGGGHGHDHHGHSH
jgi:cobalt-zinc-cadmium efflux system membrane fusion protein